MLKLKGFSAGLFLVLTLIFVNASSAVAQKKKPLRKKIVAKKVIAPNYSGVKVSQIDVAQLRALLKGSGDAKKPLLINFWATWCDPCREEFPDLVKLNSEFTPQNVDFAFISLDDLAELKREVPKFLIEMKADKISTYLLKTDNEEAAIASIDSNWQGGLPFTVLLNSDGKVVYRRMGKINSETLHSELEKVASGK